MPVSGHKLFIGSLVSGLSDESLMEKNKQKSNIIKLKNDYSMIIITWKK